jgi:hypothetical protein
MIDNRKNVKGNEVRSDGAGDPRRTALETLIKSEASGQYSNIALDNALKKSKLEENDKALASARALSAIIYRLS